jgi:hypothetical protein
MTTPEGKIMTNTILHPDTPGTKARRGWNREAEIASSRKTIAHLRNMHKAAMDKGNTALAIEIEARVQGIEARIGRYVL